MKKSFIAVLAAAAALVACSKDPQKPSKPADSVSLNKTAVELEVGASVTLTATANNDLAVVWASSNEQVATVAEGVVTAVAEGEAVISATAGEAKAECKVTVTKPEVAGQEYAWKVNVKSSWAVDVPNPTSSEVWTVEARFRKEGAWNTDGISNRLLTIGDASEQGFMLRFNDDGGKHVGGEDYGILQVVCAATGSFYMGKNDGEGEGPQTVKNAEGGQIELYKFLSDTWYTISFVNDGAQMFVYVNGELAATINDANYEFKLERIDLGMVWADAGTDHNGKTNWPYRQSFDGDLAYLRFWTKACADSEIKANLCGVANDAEGLEMNLAFSEGEGTLIADKTGHGHDFDLTKAWWDPSGHQSIQDAGSDPAQVAEEHWSYTPICEE